MSELTFLEQFESASGWPTAPAKRRFRNIKRVNRGMEESHRLALTMRGVIDRSLDDLEGLQASDYSSYQIFEAGDLVFKLIDLENIKTSRVGHVPRRGIMSPAYIRLAPNNRANSRYYYWYFYAAYLNNIFNGMGGGVRQNLTPTDLLEFPIPLPDLDTQKAIADVLDKETARIDQLIKKKRRLVELLGEREKSSFGAALSDFTTTQQLPLHRFCKILTGKTPSRTDPENFTSSGLPWATPANLGHWEPIFETKERLSAGGAAGQPIVEPGTVLVNGIGASLGKVGRAGTRLSFNQQIHAVVQTDRVFRDLFFFLLLRSLQEEMVALSTNTTIPILNGERFGRIAAPLLSPGDQVLVEQRVAKVHADCVQIDATTRTSIDRLKEYRSALITAAVTGQIDVTRWGQTGEGDKRLDHIQEEMAG